MPPRERVRRIAQVCTLLRGLTVLAFVTVLVCGVTGLLAGGAHMVGRPWPQVMMLGTHMAPPLRVERRLGPAGEAAPPSQERQAVPQADGPQTAPSPAPQEDVIIERRFERRLPLPGGAPEMYFFHRVPGGADGLPPLPGPGQRLWSEGLPPAAGLGPQVERTTAFTPRSGGWPAYALATLSIALILFILFQFERLFAAYADGEIFTEKNALRLGIIGALVAVAGLFPMLSLAAAIRARLTGDILSLGVDLTPNMGLAAVGAFLVLVAYLMREGSMLAREVEDTV